MKTKPVVMYLESDKYIGMQWDGTEDGAEAILSWIENGFEDISEHIEKCADISGDDHESVLYIEIDDDNYGMLEGDWIIKSPADDFSFWYADEMPEQHFEIIEGEAYEGD